MTTRCTSRCCCTRYNLIELSASYVNCYCYSSHKFALFSATLHCFPTHSMLLSIKFYWMKMLWRNSFSYLLRSLCLSILHTSYRYFVCHSLIQHTTPKKRSISFPVMSLVDTSYLLLILTWTLINTMLKRCLIPALCDTNLYTQITMLDIYNFILLPAWIRSKLHVIAFNIQKYFYKFTFAYYYHTDAITCMSVHPLNATFIFLINSNASKKYLLDLCNIS